MLLRGNCLELLKTLPDNSIDSIVTDPPYGLEFMGKDWDAPWRNAEVVEVTGKKANGVFADKGFTSGVRYNKGIKEMLAFQEWFTTIAEELFRVLKPGGHLLSFGGTRTYHRMACAIEDAGFEIRDSIHWTYGSGFPKSMDISKQLDKMSNAKRDEWPTLPMAEKGEVGEISKNRRCAICMKPLASANPCVCDRTSAPITPEAQKWKGWGTALKPSHEPIVVARKPTEGTVAKNVLAYGTGALNIDGTRVVGSKGDGNWKGVTDISAQENIYAGGWDGSVQSEEPTTDNGQVGRWPANTILTHSLECEPAGEIQETFGGGAKATSGFVNGYEGDGFVGRNITTSVWNCVEGCPVKALDEQSGDRPSTGTPTRPAKSGVATTGGFGGSIGKGFQGPLYSDEGGASRFFSQSAYSEADFVPFIYQAKANKKERNAGLDDLEKRVAQKWNEGGIKARREETAQPVANVHPTVKPVELMRHLVRLVTPKGGVVLDPFLGSGTTAVAAILEGCEWVGCEMTEDYWAIIEARVAWAERQITTDEPKPVANDEQDDNDQMSLF